MIDIARRFHGLDRRRERFGGQWNLE
jgi:hypothetical protein